ncbi:MAG: exo-alpha-sialidase [Chloroflexi bacterium]|nr:MAG: exo-alpha-sialidase [Chloroflexota bacterium]
MRRPLVTIGLALALSVSFFAMSALADIISGFTEKVSPDSETNATEPSVAIDRADGTIYVAWQASGTHVARSDDGGRTFVQTPIMNPFGNDIGDVDVRVGGPTPCMTANTGCLPGTHRVYVTSLERLPFLLQTHLAYSDDRGANWTINNVAAFNPSFIDRPWLAVYPSKTNASADHVYISYHDFTASQIWVASSSDGGQTFVQTNVFANDPNAEIQSFCNTVPSGIEVDPQTGEVYVQWITADPAANTTQGCNITQIENFHQVWVAHSANNGVTWDAHPVFDGGAGTNTDDIFATLAVDDSGAAGVSGNVYSVFADNLNGASVFDIWFSHSSNRGSMWSLPVKVNSDKGTHFFPWIAAGSTGRVDFIWLNSPDYTPTDAEQSPWYVTFAQTTNGTAASPKFNQTSASSSVMHVGGICTNGIFCSISGGNRDLADSISIAIDRGGSATLVWTDQGQVLHGPTWITSGCVTSQQTAIVGAKPGLSCKGPAGP